jgi:DNA (cytosine-5)-methyltransferase 1
MNQPLTLGSLFDGIGGFCLAGQYAGVKPLWSSEIEPFPVRVTEKRFPDVLQLGDVHGIDGGAIPPVDVVTFGSPCQNLSVAGKRAGLGGEQSSLFFEAVRIIKEMRRSTNGQYPRWAVWENVPGALSSNEGRDFQAVLSSLAQIKDGQADVPLPEKGKWLGAGEILGDGYSVAWRVLDASKGWGVAQRRRRIFAVLDLGGACAGPVLFESEGLSGYSPPSEAPGQRTPGGPESRAGASGFCTEHSADSRGIGYGKEESPTLRAGVVPGVAIEYNPSDCRLKVKEDGICQTLTARCGTGGNNVPLTIGEPTVYGICSDQSHSMLSGNPHSGIYEAETSRTLDCNGGSPVCNQGGMAVVETYAIQGNMIGREDHNGPQGGGVNEEVSFTLNTVDRHAVCMHTAFYESAVEMTPALMARDYKDPPIVNPEYLVRRLTPLECCRLQGYPDGWCKGLESADPAEEEISRWEKVFAAWDAVQGKRKPKTRKQIINWLRHPNTDAAEYKAYGNSVAVPCVFFILAGIVWAAGKELSE